MKSPLRSPRAQRRRRGVEGHAGAGPYLDFAARTERDPARVETRASAQRRERPGAFPAAPACYLARMIQYSDDGSALDPAELAGLFERGAGWRMPRALDAWRDLVANTPLLLVAREEGRLIGFARLLTDFVRYANLYDVVVAPEFRGRGVGTELVRRLIDHPRVARVRTFWLASADSFSFYERFGFCRDGAGHGMFLVRGDRDAELTEPKPSPAPTGPPRPAFIVSGVEVPGEAYSYPGTAEVLAHGRDIGSAAGLLRLGVNLVRVEPGHRTSYPHAHEATEEFFYVLEGEVECVVDGVPHRMVAGDFAAFPSGTGIAHTVRNPGPEAALLLVGGEHSGPGDRVVYPENPERKQAMAPGRWWERG